MNGDNVLGEERIEQPSQSELLALLDYDPETGRLTWLPRPLTMFEDGEQTAAHRCARWNASWAGKEAFIANSHGYRSGSIHCHRYLAHRIIFKMVTGRDPDQIDHIDGDPSNNRWANLREVSALGNRKNAALSANNKTGVPGVCWHKRTARWRALGSVNGRQVALGYFHSFDAAVEARLAWQQANGFHANHGRQRAA